MVGPGEQAILAGLEQVARRHLRWEGTLRGDERLIETLRLDSVRLLTLIVELENHFRVCLDLEGGAAGIETVADLVAAIRSKLEPSPDAA